MFEWIQVGQWIIYALVLFYVDLNYLLFIISSFFPEKAGYKKIDKYPKVSVIIPTRNEAHVIEETLKRLRKSDYPKSKLEIIVVDANSYDGTAKIAKKYADKVIIEKHPKGKPHALNLGIRKASGELIYFLDADNWVNENTIKKLVSSMETNAIVGFTTIRNQRKLIEKVSILENNLHNVIMIGLFRLFKIEIVPGCNFLISKKILKRVGYYKDTLTEDINLSLRLYKIGERVNLINAPCSIVVPKSLKSYWKQQKRWRRGGIDEIRKMTKTVSATDLLIKMPFITLAAITGTVGLIMLIIGIIFSDFIFLTGFIFGILILIAAKIKYNKDGLIYLPVVYIYYTIIEIVSLVKVLFEEITNKKVVWQKTPK